MWHSVSWINGGASWHTCKGLVGTSKNNCTNILISIEFAKSFVQLEKEGRGEGIEGLGSVESDCMVQVWLEMGRSGMTAVEIGR